MSIRVGRGTGRTHRKAHVFIDHYARQGMLDHIRWLERAWMSAGRTT